MPLTNAYRDYVAQVTIGEAVTAFNEANSRIGVGDSTTAFVATQTDLVASTNKFRKAVNTGFPTRAANVLTFDATFATGEANFAWQEWGTFNAGPTGGVMLNRRVESLGTKTSAQSWKLTVTLTLNV